MFLLYLCAKCEISLFIHVPDVHVVRYRNYTHQYILFNMECHKDLIKKPLTKCKQTVDLKKMLQIVEGGFNTQEINSAFDYDMISSKDESLSSSITPSDKTESSSDNEEVAVIPPTPKKGKLTNLFKLIMQNL